MKITSLNTDRRFRRCGAGLSAFALLLAGACSDPPSTGREVHYEVPVEVFVLSDDLDEVEFSSGESTELEVQTVLLNNVGHEGIIVPAECELTIDAAVDSRARLSVAVGLHTTDWANSLEKRMGLPKVSFLLVGSGEERELFSVNFADPELAARPRWVPCLAEYTAEEAKGRELVVRVEPEAGHQRQVRACLGRLIVEDQVERVALAPFVLGTLEVPAAFREKLPVDLDAAATFERWVRNYSFLEQALESRATDELRGLTRWAVADQEDAFQEFVHEHGEALFWELWAEVSDSVAVMSGHGEGGSPSPLRDPRAKPDVVVFVIDCARRDHFSAYGYERETTPRIQALLADSGVVYDHSYSTGTATNFSMPSMMTSRYSTEHRFYVTMSLRRGERTLAEQLRVNGYLTLGVVSNPYLVAGSGMEQGYFWYDSMEHDFNSYPKGERVLESAREMLPFLRWFPTYLYVHLMDAHGPYRPSAPFDRAFDGQPYSAADDQVNQRMSPPFDGRETFSIPVGERAGYANVDRAIALYDGELAYTDHHLGAYLEEMQAQGLFENAGILLTADHGEEFFEHGFTYHNSIPHEEKVSIPMIIKPPAGHPAAVPSHVGQRIDVVLGVMPTVLSLAGADLPPGVHGEDLLAPELLNDTGPPRTVLHDNGFIHALHEGSWKLIHSPNKQEGLDKIPEFRLAGGYRPMLFDLDRDAGEQQNRAAGEEERFEALGGDLQQRVRSLAKGVLKGDPDEESGRLGDPEILERLRALGYTGEAPPD